MTPARASAFPWPDGLLRATARALVHGVAGRTIGVVLFCGPIVAFLWSLAARGWTTADLWVWPLLAVPTSLGAFFLHECGHLTVLWLLGIPSRFFWRLPIDMRAVPLVNRPEDSTGVNRVRRGLAGWLVNCLCVLAGVVLTLSTHQPVWAFLALPHGFAALSATAWVVHVSNQDAATLAGGLRLSDRLSLDWLEAPGRLRVTGQVAGRGEQYWILLQGVPSVEVDPPGHWLVFDLDASRILLVRRQTGNEPFALVVYGRPTGAQVRLLSACGTEATISVQQETE